MFIQRSRWRGWRGCVGDFAATLNLTQGTYRARVLPFHGYVFGTSQLLKVLPA